MEIDILFAACIEVCELEVLSRDRHYFLSTISWGSIADRLASVSGEYVYGWRKVYDCLKAGWPLRGFDCNNQTKAIHATSI